MPADPAPAPGVLPPCTSEGPNKNYKNTQSNSRITNQFTHPLFIVQINSPWIFWSVILTVSIIIENEVKLLLYEQPLSIRTKLPWFTYYSSEYSYFLRERRLIINSDKSYYHTFKKNWKEKEKAITVFSRLWIFSWFESAVSNFKGLHRYKTV